MRTIPINTSNKIHSRVQTLANNCNPVLDVRVCRPETPLTNEVYLERQTVLRGVNVTDASVAVTHPNFGYNYSNTKIFLAYISDGTLRVQTASGKVRMQDHVWSDMGIEIPASACSIALDGTMPKNTKGEVEFITEPDPWLFWIRDSVLYGQKVGGGEPVVLAEANCTDVSAIRAMWSSPGGFDFGLVVFFLLSGQLYYRQLISGEWKDAEPVNFGPEGVSWKEVAAFRTWDYRVGVQAKTADGEVYELFTQYMGIAKQGTEHINVNTRADVDLIKLTYHEPIPQEHISISGIQTGAPYGGFYEVQPPHFVAAENVPDENGDWGRVLKVVMSNHMRAKGVSNNAASFVITDERGLTASAVTATLDIEDGLTITLTFVNFNSMRGVCSISYTPGDATNMADTVLEYTELSFIPRNLVPPDVPVPEPIALWNE